ncbi:conserved hypothetical protein [Bradyrhizobium sp. STM 3843]|uniref:hypothetical protein n=1 Tax=Bradyrhizobium sp. STM 3843 TaxID=551947 RepID=UPI000240B06C|nr:hypothetical protein [Bradyrhizobium sp. STM 3843]CCE07041.1 conserved hypothetical protein [Bradyrhizobium sp. STM 3843]
MHGLEILIRFFAVLSEIRGHIPQSDGFPAFSNHSRPDASLAGTFIKVLGFVAAAGGVAAALATISVAALHWLS